MPLDPHIERAILAGIQQIPADQLAQLIQLGNITLEQVLESPNLDQRKRKELLEILAPTQPPTQPPPPPRTGTRGTGSDPRPPTPPPPPVSNTFIQELAAGNKNLRAIKMALADNNISKEDLLAAGMRDEWVRFCLEYEEKNDISTWKDLPPLLDNRTDIYFFGQPGSGKSCILASVLRRGWDEGIFLENVHSPKGNEYRNSLLIKMRNGILPDSTQSGVNYIPLDLISNREHHKHPLNFIEMGGELFDEAFRSGLDNFREASNYLNNNNRKLIFFIIDFERHNDSGWEADQSIKMTQILEFLGNANILKSTDGIYLIVSKADRFPTDDNPSDYAFEFLQRHYKTFMTNCKHHQSNSDNDFKVIVYPYSIGDVRFNGFVENLNTESPDRIIELIRNFTFRSGRGSWIKNILG